MNVRSMHRLCLDFLPIISTMITAKDVALKVSATIASAPSTSSERKVGEGWRLSSSIIDIGRHGTATVWSWWLTPSQAAA